MTPTSDSPQANLVFPPDQYDTLRVLIHQALSSDCKCLSCKGLVVLAKRIVKFNDKKSNESR